MTRPLYESAADRDREATIIASVADAWRVRFEKLPIRYELDYAAMRGADVVAWCEVKSRTTPHNAYATYHLSLAKWRTGVGLAAATKRPFVLIVQFADLLAYCRLTTEPLPVVIGGRKDRADAQDVEPVVAIPINRFARVRAPAAAGSRPSPEKQ